MRSILTRALVLASFLVSIGMHTALLQAVAWARMTVDFARRDSIEVALKKTFDGRHPCPICCSLKNTGSPASVAAAPLHSALCFVLPTAAPRAARVAVVWDAAAPAPPAFARSLAPIAPPPKAVLS
jgi:hypothetical protein